MPTNYDIQWLEPASLREVWPGEATDFTPWLADNLARLDIPGLGELTREAVEMSLKSGRSADIVARTIDDRRVIIENQFGVLDHDHLTRALAYALELGDTAAVVVIAERHRPEFVRIAEYLNVCFDDAGPGERIAVFLVTALVGTVAGVAVPRFELTAAPASAVVREEQELSGAQSAGSYDHFISAADPTIRSHLASVIREWQSGTLRTVDYQSKQRAALRIATAWRGPSKTVAALGLGLDGSLGVNRGYLLDHGVFDDEATAEFDAVVDRLFPGFVTGEKRYYLNVKSVTVESIRAFGEWLDTRFASAPVASAEYGSLRPPGPSTFEPEAGSTAGDE